MGVEDSYNFRRVSDHVTTSGSLTADQLASLAQDGIAVVVNLNPDGGSNAVDGEGDLVRDQGVEYVYLPVDFAAPTRADFEAFATAMDTHEGRRVHVHCAANFRVSAFYSAYAVRKGWWNADEADAHVGDLWDPAQYPPWSDLIAELRAAG